MARLTTKSTNKGFMADVQESLKGSLTQSASARTIGLEAINLMTGGTDAVISNENLSDLRSEIETIFNTAYQNNSGDISANQASLEAMSFGNAKPTRAQLDAAAFAAAASANVETARAYMKAAVSTETAAPKDVDVIGYSSNPAFGYGDETGKNFSLEAFDARNLENNRVFNVMFAFSAARQDEFAEAFFKTVTLSPDNAGFEVSIRRTMIMSEMMHSASGTPLPLQDSRKNLLDAYNDYTILQNQSTQIFPRYDANDAVNQSYFVDPKLVTPWPTLANGGAQITTSALKIGVETGIVGLGINQNTKGTPNQTDALDHSVKITNIYVQITTSAGSSVIKVNTRNYQGNTFLKSQQGLDRRINLDFPLEFTISGNTTDYLGNPATALSVLKAAPFTNTTVNLHTDLSGNGNVAQGAITVNATAPTVKGARNVAGANDYTNITDAATLSNIRGLIQSAQVIGYEVLANTANLNRREIGLLIDSVEERVRYVIPLGCPISVQTPITATTTATDMAGPMNAQRISNSLNAVTKLFEIKDTLTDIAPLINYRSPTDPAPAIEGFGRVMVRPYLVNTSVNVANIVSSPATANRLQDVQAAIVNKIRYAVVQAYTESRYQPVLDAYNGNAGERPHVVIGTDPTTASYLMINGDPRILGLGFETKVVVSYDIRVRGKIFASFVRPNVTEVDVMSLGTFAYIPELATTAQLPYGGANSIVTQVQNRNLHVCLLPVLVYIEVDGLETAASDQVAYPVSMN